MASVIIALQYQRIEALPLGMLPLLRDVVYADIKLLKGELFGVGYGGKLNFGSGVSLKQ